MTFGAIGGALAGAFATQVVGGLMGPSGSPAPPPPQYASYSQPANAIGSLFSGLGLAGIGPLSQADLKKAAGMADPFADQRSQYYGALSDSVGSMEGLIGNAGSRIQGIYDNFANQGLIWGGQTVSGLAGSAGTARIDPALAGLGVYDPSTNFRYQQGLDAVSRGAAAGGTLGTPAQMLALEQYGQGFASTEYQNQFQRQATLQQLMNSTQQQNFAQNATLQQLYDTEQQQTAQRAFEAYGLGSNVEQMQIAGESQLGTLLATLTGASTGSPAMAGKIMSGGFGQSQDNLNSFLRGISGMFPGAMPGGGAIPGLGGVGSAIGRGLGAAFNGMNVDPNNPYSLAPYDPSMPPGYYNDTSVGGGSYGLQAPPDWGNVNLGTDFGGYNTYTPSTDFNVSPDYSLGAPLGESFGGGY